MDDIIVEMARNWEAMTAGERRKEVAQLAGEYGVSESTVYRRVNVFLREGRRVVTGSRGPRNDRGKPRGCGPEELQGYVQIVMGLKSLDPNQPDKRVPNPNKTMSTERAIEIAERLGRVPEGVLSARTVNRWAHLWQITPQDICAPGAAVKLESLHPNHVHVIDFSVCEQYYLRDSDGKVMERTWTYPGKPNEAKKKIWAFALVDHYSTVKWIRYFLSPGESSRILYQGIVEAWEKKNDSKFPFHGAPTMIYADKGSALKAGMIDNLLQALGVKVEKHMPGNPRAKGMVESAFAHFQKGFESELRLCPASSLEALNERAYNWLVTHNWSVPSTGSGTGAGSVSGKSRFQIWQEITTEQLLEMPSSDILRRVTATNVIRTVDAYSSIRYGNEVYGVPEDLVGRKVRVWTNIDGGLSVQDVESGEMFPTGDRKTAVFGEFRSHKKTDAERMQDEALEMAEAARKKITPEMLRRDVPNLHAMPRTGTKIEVRGESGRLINRPYEAAAYGSVFEAKMAIAEELRMNLGDLPEWMREEIDAALMEGLEKEKVRRIARYVGGFLQKQAV